MIIEGNFQKHSICCDNDMYILSHLWVFEVGESVFVVDAVEVMRGGVQVVGVVRVRQPGTQRR